VFLIALMLLNMIVFNLNMFVNSCNVLNIGKYYGRCMENFEMVYWLCFGILWVYF
jgi:hypothetical protein